MGASGDLAPLAHLALALLGEGQMWSPRSGWADASLVSTHFCLPVNPIDLFSLYILFSHFRPRDALMGIFLLFFH